jgi:hypothetical protein
MLRLPDVTLTMVETIAHKLGRLAVNDCVSKAEFADVVIFTDKPEEFHPLDCDAHFVEVPNWPTKREWSKFSWHGVGQHVCTAMTLHVQWDSGIWCPDAWSDEFLDYDLIGAPWPWHPTKRIGNLGFSFRSTRIMRYLYKHRDRFPINTDVDDDLVCRKYRPQLEIEGGFTWAPERVAERFAFECAEPDMTRKHWGWHAAFNFGHVFDEQQVMERARLMLANPYIQRSFQMRAFADKNPHIIKRLADENAQELLECAPQAAA